MIGIIEVFAKLAMLFIEFFIKKMDHEDKQKAAFEQFAELARVLNLKSIADRMDVEKQLKMANDEWAKIEQGEKNETDRLSN